MSDTHWQPSGSLENLKIRARLLQSIRAFFAERKVLEVETPALSPASVTDPQLQSFITRYSQSDYYLQTSPEFYMKRLLAAGSGDIYQIARVFRLDEKGRHHNPEFSLLEWYRLAFDHHQLMDEVEQLLQCCMSFEVTVRRVSYQQAFQQALEIDPLTSDAQQLQACALQHQIEVPQGMTVDDKDMWLDWLMVSAVAPAFEKDRFIFIYDYPASQAALARLSSEDARVAHRFELYYGELELANGFYELTDAAEQRRRFESENLEREKSGLSPVPIDERLLSALESGLPDCAGVALGLDRLLMLMTEAGSISEVMGFSVE